MLSPKHIVPFFPNEDGTRKDRKRTAQACAEYNKLHPDCMPSVRNCTFQRIFDPTLAPDAKVANAPTVLPPFHVDYGSGVSIDDTVYIDSNCRIVNTPITCVKIRKYCTIGPNVTVSSAGPPLSPIDEERLKSGQREISSANVSIGRRVWIGASAVIGPGVTIGDGAIVAPGAVILDDVPEDAVVRGNPATIVAT
ncbi:trimeric LpxA-like protein [Hypoxylon sp. FL1150]|nr:trimeric LpxA-like protein [Hypoxylon sp. FL1150]